MHRLFPNWLFGALVGFCVGVLAWTGHSFFGLELPRLYSVAFYSVGAAFGAVVGSLDRTVARWCAGTAVVVGAVSFALGFIGPILLEPDSPQGPLLGIFVTGPYGFIAGALLGLVIGIVQQYRRPVMLKPTVGLNTLT